MNDSINDRDELSYVEETHFIVKNATSSDRRSCVQPQQTNIEPCTEIIVTEGSGANSHLQRLGIRKRSKSRGDIIVPMDEGNPFDNVGYSAASEAAAV